MQQLLVKDLIQALFAFYGPQNWWPAQARFEVVVGAILVQNTAWVNVEHAIRNLRISGKLRLSTIRSVEIAELERLIRPAGFFRQKAATIRGFVEFLDTQHDGSLRRLFAQATDIARSQLLAIKGIGPETADSILLYAGGHPVLVIDTYTRRIWERHKLIPPNELFEYERVRAAAEAVVRAFAVLEPSGDASPRHRPSRISRKRLAGPAERYKQLHAMIVRVGSTYCKVAPACSECPLRHLL
jgi:endonuclease III related protein